MPTYRLTIEYQGTRYHGWQEQKNARSVAGALRAACEAAGAVVVEIGGSGRTDRGVHALAQVAHLRVRQRVDAAAFRMALNDELPHDISVLALAPAHDRFHARHDAVARSYLYQLSRRRTAFGRDLVWWIKREMNLEHLRLAASSIVGKHDFRAFCERPNEQPSTIVAVLRAEVVEAGDLILLRLVASHFLWKMVRRVTGTLVRVAWGDVPQDAIARFLADPENAPRGDDGPAAWTAPPSGLFLERVLYPGDPELGPLVPVLPLPSVATPRR